MAPKAGQFPYALPPDPQTSAAEPLLVITDLHRARRAEQLLVACATHQLALDRGLQPLPRLRGQGALDPRRHRHRRLDLEADVDQRPVLLALDQILRGRLDRLALEGHRPGVERRDAAEPESAGAEHGRTPVGPIDRPTKTVVTQPEHPPVRKGDVDLDVVRSPVRRNGLNSDARQSHCAMVVDDPEAHRVAHFRIVGLAGEYLLTRRVDATGQINCHASSLRRSRGTAAGPCRDRCRTPPGRRASWALVPRPPQPTKCASAIRIRRRPVRPARRTTRGPRGWDRPAWRENRCRRSVYRLRRRGSAALAACRPTSARR